MGLKEIVVKELQEIHSAENQLARMVPRLVKAADSGDLQAAFEERLQEGEQIIADVESALEQLEATAGRKKNVAAEGLINDMREHIQEMETGPALDTVLIGALQKTEHYCIAAWGTTKALGEALGEQELVQAMERALDEGKSFDERLTQFAEAEITPQLQGQEGGEDEDEDEEEDEESEDDESEDEDDEEDDDDDEDEDEDESGDEDESEDEESESEGEESGDQGGGAGRRGGTGGGRGQSGGRGQAGGRGQPGGGGQSGGRGQGGGRGQSSGRGGQQSR